MACEHEKELRRKGWVPEIKLIVYAKDGEEEREIHFHGPRTKEDLDALIAYLKGLRSGPARQRTER